MGDTASQTIEEYKRIKTLADNKHFRRGEANKVISTLCQAVIDVISQTKPV